MASQPHTPSRRALLGALSLAPVVGLLAAVPYVAGAQVPDRTAWDTAKLLRDRAWGQFDAYSARHEPIVAEYRRLIDQVPHATFGPDPHSGTLESLTTANPAHVSLVRRATRGRYWIDPQYPSVVDAYAQYERFKAADEQRAAAIAAIGERTGYSASIHEYDRLLGAAMEADEALILTPAPTRAELLWKIEHLHGPGATSSDGSSADYGGEINSALMADARRLLGGEA